MNNNKEYILYVDDEDPNIVAFRAIFRRDFNVITATSAQEGKEKLDEFPQIKVIVSDYLMRGITGVEFFQSILETHSDKIRIMLTGFADQTVLQDAINKAGVYRFLSKPWNEHDLRRTIYSAIEIYDARKQISIYQKELEEAFEDLNSYVHKSSNEMRSTLVSMHGIVRIAKMESKSETDTDYWSIIEKGILQIDLQLRNIIEHYQNNEPVQAFGLIDFDKIIQATLEALSVFQDFGKIKINIKNHNNTDFYNDKFRMQLAFSNMLMHIVEQINPQKGLLNLDIEIIDDIDRVKIIFTDDGMGVENGQLSGLFDLIMTKGTSQDISLYLVKQTVENMEGTVTVVSLLGEGSSFELRIPNQLDAFEAQAKPKR
ncbi:MAG: hybrid sensor histidine kinase/response regulator [Flavobacteriales bacterium]|nr:hybrid sensor histidine kinase/response regulator [Flavobacteriales bacterium]